MKLDSADQAVLEFSRTNPQDAVTELYGKELSYDLAKKYMSGIRLHLRHKEGLGEIPPAKDMNELVIKADGTRTTTRMLLLSEEDSQDPNRIMQLMGFDPLQWELLVCERRRNYWNTITKNFAKDGVKHTSHSYKCTVKVKPIATALTSDYVRSVFEDIEPPKLKKYEYKPGGMMLELPIMDPHLGQPSWLAEAGAEYSLKIAEKLYRSTIVDILGKVVAYGLKFERIVFPIGQDFFHVDTVKGTTTAGTELDMDVRWQEMYKTGVDLLTWTIEQLRSIAPVDVMYVPGNHDRMMSYCATVTVDAYYKDIEAVSVDLSPKPRKYIHYGINLIGLAHGQDEKKNIEHLMQVEQPKAWGETIFREWHLGHLHTESAKEVGGVIIRRISAMTAPNAWHSEKGFVSAVRKAQAFVWDKEKGKQLTIDSNVIVKR